MTSDQPGLFPEDAVRPEPAPRAAPACQPGVQWRPGHDEDPPQRGMIYNGTCRGCKWEGPDQPHENAAVEDAHDHAWPGWRDQPLMPPAPMEDTAGWLARAKRIYPAGWVDNGGPIRTVRPHQIAGRHHRSHLWDGFDMGVVLGQSGSARRQGGAPRAAISGEARPDRHPRL